MDSILFFACDYLILPAPYIKETILHLLNIFGFTVNYQLTIHAWVYFAALLSVLLVYESVYASIILVSFKNFIL